MSRRQPYLFAILTVLLALGTVGALRREAPPASPGPPPAAADLDTRPLAASLAPAAEVLRSGDCAAALATVTAEADGATTSAGRAFHATVAGLYAHACGEDGLAELKLLRGAAAGGALEDWRLLVLARTASERDHAAVARSALERLLADHPGSPLRPDALVESVRAARRFHGPEAALAEVERARREGLRGEPAAAVEEVAWEVGRELAHRGVQAEAARRLLVDHPQRAEELSVLDLFDAGGGDPVDLAGVLAADDLVRRARGLLASRRPVAASEALAAVPPERRDVTWRLLSAEALTAEDRGLAALAALDGVRPADPAELAHVEWRRALAAFDAARVRRGRTPLPSAERERLRDEALRHLLWTARQRADRELAGRALRVLFGELWDDDRVEDALDVLARLRELDPHDTSGARSLWEAGWSEFVGRNPSGAVGYWSELVSLYPESAYARNGRYWTARAHEELGHGDRARSIYREVVAADTGDFYTRYARERLGGAVPASASAPLAEDRGVPWPDHPDLARARLLSDLGLDRLALHEIALQRGDRGTPSLRRAATALEALVLARSGDRRESIRRIRDAFPALGGPLQATAPAPALRLYYPLAHAAEIREQAARHGLPPHLVLGMVRQESGFDRDATSRAGARGLMQLMPATGREVARRLGMPWAHRRLAEPSYNLALGTAYFHQVLEMFDGDVELALAGYNGGPYRIKRLWRRAGPNRERDVFLEGLPVAESRIYLKRILLLTDSYRQLYPRVSEQDAGTPEPS